MAGFGFWDYDLQSGQSWWSEGVWHLAGLEPEAFPLAAEPPFAILQPEDRAAAKRLFQEALMAQRDFCHRARVRRPDESLRYVEIRGFCRLREGGQIAGYFGIIQDISSQLETELRLVEANERAAASRRLLEAATDAAFDGFAVFDPDDRLILCNRAFSALYEAEPQALIGLTFEELQRLPAFRRRLGLEDDAAFEVWLEGRLRLHQQADGPPREVRGGDLCLWVHERRLPDGSIVLCRTDISALKRSEAELRALALEFARARNTAEQALQLLRAATEVLSDGFALFDPEDRLLLCNRAFAALYGSLPAELEGRRYAELIEHYLTRHRPQLDAEVRGRYLASRLAMHARADGTPLHLEADGRHYVVREHRVPGGYTVVLHSEVTHLKQVERELRRLATIDELTELANRRAFFDHGRRLLERAQRNGRPMALLLFDLDHFKQINDAFGHAAGDLVLRRVAATCRELLRSEDLVARLGGEEFAVLLHDAEAQEAERVAERLRAAITGLAIDHEGRRIGVTISLGIALPGPGCETLEACLAAADRALYRAKRSGRNRLCLAPPAQSMVWAAAPSARRR